MSNLPVLEITYVDNIGKAGEIKYETVLLITSQALMMFLRQDKEFE